MATSTRTLRLLRGDLSNHWADAIATSANRYLSGNASPGHWRFTGRENVDGALRRAGGKELDRLVAAALPDKPLEPGHAHRTASAGALAQSCSWIIHCCAPDGLYGEQTESGTRLLYQTYVAVIEAAAATDSRSLACPAIGCGVQGHRPAAAAREAFAAARCWLDGGIAQSSRLSLLEFVCFADDVWAAWPPGAIKALGRPPDERSEQSLIWHARRERLAC